MRMPLTGITTTALLLALAGCGGGGSEPPPEYPPVEPPPPTPTTMNEMPEPTEPEPPPPPAVEVVAAERSPIEGNNPIVRIAAPRNNQTIRRGDVTVRLQVRNWDLEPDPGRHVHLIVDNQPYIAIRDVSSPINLTELYRETFGTDLPEGTHVLRVFPSRGHHESVKTDRAFAMTVFHVASRTEDFELDRDAPMLTFSRPKGCNTAGERVLLDFYLSNVDELSAEGHRVHYTIDQLEGDITTWAPHYIENLQPGEHRIRLQLLGEDGQPVAGMFNDTQRTISVAASCPSAAPAAPAEEAEDEEGEEAAEE